MGVDQVDDDPRGDDGSTLLTAAGSGDWDLSVAGRLLQALIHLVAGAQDDRCEQGGEQ